MSRKRGRSKQSGFYSRYVSFLIEESFLVIGRKLQERKMCSLNLVLIVEMSDGVDGAGLGY